MNSRCQSCGMPFSKDPQKGGTNADGSKSSDYCSLCFKYGEFTDTFTSAREMQDFAREQLEEKGYGRIARYFMTLDIPRLARWRKKY